MSHRHSMEWETAIADASRFAAWSHDIAHLQRYMATPGKLLPWEVPIALRKLESGQFEVVCLLSNNDPTPDGLWRGIAVPPEPQTFSPLIIRGPDGLGEPIFTNTEVIFNGDQDTNDYAQDFQITLQQLKASCKAGCTSNMYSYDILVRCAIVRLAHYFPTIRVFSDGGKSAIDIAVKICRYVFEDTNIFPLWKYDDED